MYHKITITLAALLLLGGTAVSFAQGGGAGGGAGGAGGGAAGGSSGGAAAEAPGTGTSGSMNCSPGTNGSTSDTLHRKSAPSAPGGSTR